MRCTKCSFISFDDLSACAKCSNDLSHLSKELNGTCTETRQEFFLGTAIQATGLAEDNFSDSQILPPIDHSEVNFDDTNTSRFIPPAAADSSADVSGLGFDDSLAFAAEDDVAIELGDIMPLDLDQLDSASVSPDLNLDSTDASSLDDFNFDFDKTNRISGAGDNEIDLDLAGGFGDSDSDFKFGDDLSSIDDSSFDLSGEYDNVTTSLSDKTFTDVHRDQYAASDIELDQELLQQFSDDDGGLDETISLNLDVGLDDTQVSPFPAGDEPSTSLELDESLVAELAGVSALDASGEFSVDFSTDHSASGEFVFDEALVAELAGEENVATENGGDLSLATEAFSGPVAVEDVTGDFPPLREDDEVELSGLDLADIDVSDLVDTSAGVFDSHAHDGQIVPQDELADQSRAAVFPSVEDTVREQAVGLPSEQEDFQVDASPALGFDEVLMGEALAGFDDLNSAGADTDSVAKDIDLSGGAATSSFDHAAFSLNDTLQDGDEGFVLPISDGEDVPEDDISLTDLSLDHFGESDDLSLGADALAFDDELESFLGNEVAAKKIPVIELVDDDDGPPDLPA